MKLHLVARVNTRENRMKLCWEIRKHQPTVA